MTTPKRGFAKLTAVEHKAVSQKGGTTSQRSGRGHRWDAAAAREAGLKGGRPRKRTGARP